LKDEQFLANPFNVIDYLSDWFGWFLGVGHDANRLLFCAGEVGTLTVRTPPLNGEGMSGLGYRGGATMEIHFTQVGS
jgi:hypothetical protein